MLPDPTRPDPTAVLRQYPAQCRPLDEPADLAGAGGLSGSRLWRFASGRGALVLRAWPSPGPTRAHLERVHGWLARAADLGWIPNPIAGLDGLTIREHAGRLWELAPWIDGTPDASGTRRVAGFRGLAALHRRWESSATTGPSPGLVDRLSELDVLSARGFARLGRAVGASARDALGEEAARWLDLAPRLAPSVAERLRQGIAVDIPRQPCLRDVRRDHFLFRGDDLAGLVDFGAMGEDTIAGDLARLLADWPGDDAAARAEALAAYETIRPLDAAERGLISVFEASGALLAGAHWLRWHYLEGRTFDDPGAVRAGVSRSVARLERLSGAPDPRVRPIR